MGWDTAAASFCHPAVIGDSSKRLRHASPRGGFLFNAALRLFELARVLVRLDHTTRIIVNVWQAFEAPGV
jgi:hypothetical protein